MRYPLEVFAAVRAGLARWSPDLGEDLGHRLGGRAASTGTTPSNSPRLLRDLGCDLVDVSTGQTTIHARPDYGRLYQTPFSDRIRHEAGIPTMTVGAVSSIDDVHNILVAGRADLVVLARPHLVDPYWTLNAALDLGYTGHPFPNQYLSGLAARRRAQDPVPPEVFRNPPSP